MSGTASLRVPRVRVLINGSIVGGTFDVAINLNNCFAAGYFRVTASVDAESMPDHRFWSTETDMMIDIQLSMNADEGFVSLIQGMADTVAVDPIGSIVRLTGRDLTSTLVDAPTQETFANRTASEIAAILASRHGLTACITPTASIVGRFYDNDYASITLDSLSRATTEWELLVHLARIENYDAYVAGTILHFHPLSEIAAATSIVRLCDVMEMRLQRTLMLGREISVTVKSWNTQQQAVFVQRATGTPLSALSTSPMVFISPPEYSLIRPNLTPDAMSDIAARQLADIARHERTLEFLMPGDATLTPRSMIHLSGTDSDFDQDYYIVSIDRTFNARRGYQQRVRASNTSPRTTIITSV